MKTTTKVWVKCRFERGVFAHEKVFFIPAPGGGEYRGVAFIKYCQSEDEQELAENEPEVGGWIDGYVASRIVEEKGEPDYLFTIQVPDGELCDVDQIVFKDHSNVSV